MSDFVDISWLCSKITDRSARRIALQVSSLIASGEIPCGVYLPPIKDFSRALGVSLGTVSNAWAVLREQGTVRGIGRQGLQVISKPVVPAPLRFANLNKNNQYITTDLSYSVPDPELLPDLRQAMYHSVDVKELNQHKHSPIIEDLKNTVMKSWPYEAESFIATNGTFEALAFLLQMIMKPGCSIAVEDPTTISLLDILKKFEVKTIPVSCDKEGPIVSSLAKALAKKPIAFIYQPRNQFPAGHTTSKKRIAELAKLFRFNSTLVIEQDIMGDISSQKVLSIGKFYPEKTIHIRSYLKAYGSDLSLAILSADKLLIDKIHNTRGFFSVGWSSRLLQQALVWLINDKPTQRQLNKARRIYNKRHNALIDALNNRGFNIPPGDGFDLWLPVRSEQIAVAILAAQGILVVPGSYFSINCPPHIRISTCLLKEDMVNRVASVLANVLSM